MPGPKTHQIFYKQLKEFLDTDTLERFPNYDKYGIFAQGHDFLIYHDFYKIISGKKLANNIYYSDRLQEFYFPEFVYSYLKNAQEMGVLDNEQIRLFIGAGYVGHHILDAYTHPFIIYYAGDHVREPQNTTWNHGIVENLLDVYLMEAVEHINCKKHPIHKEFSFKKKEILPALQKILNISLNEIYGFEEGGKNFCEAVSQIGLFMRMFKYDPTGIKRKVFDRLDPLLKGTSSFSYYRNACEAKRFLNEEHDSWCNPMDKNIVSNEAFVELYQKALKDAADIVIRLEKICRSGVIRKEDVFSIVPNIASTHGLECGKKIEIKYTHINDI